MEYKIPPRVNCSSAVKRSLSLMPPAPTLRICLVANAGAIKDKLCFTGNKELD